MKKKGEIKRQRIIVWYLIAIVIPCLVLGILAFRGIKNDQALVERELQSELRELGQEIILDTESFIKSTEDSFDGLLDSVVVPRDIIFTDFLLNRFCDQNHAVAGIFFIAGIGELYLLNNGLLYLPDDYSIIQDYEISKTEESMLEKGWQFEFRERDYRKALKYFQEILPGINNEQLTCEVLNIIARLQKKLQLYDEAVITYDQIRKGYPDVLIQNRLPAVAVALIEKGFLHLVLKDTIPALEAVGLLISQLKDPGWSLAQSHYENFISKINEIILKCENPGSYEKNHLLDKINTLKDSLSAAGKHTEYLLALSGNNELISGEISEKSGKITARRKILINGKTYLLSVTPVKDKGQWGMLTDQDFILNNTIKQSIKGHLNRSDIAWDIRDINGTLLLMSGNIPENSVPVNISFPSDLPSWAITFYPENSGLLLSFPQSGGGVFLYIFIAILIILAFGLFFTLYTVNNEIQLSVLKSNFMSTVSHEFKSPLTSIRQMAEMLVHRRVPTPERQQKYFITILRQSERLSHLIDNILDFSRMEEGKKLFSFVKGDIVTVVRDVVKSFKNQPAGQGFDIDLEIAEPIPEIYFDIEAIEQVMNNLIDNSIKYSGDSGKVEIDLQKKGDSVIISIKDYGIGIKKADQDKIFNRFYRAGDELTQTVKGSGIGLTIVRQIVEAHHGTIDVESEVSKGSKFTVRLPVDL